MSGWYKMHRGWMSSPDFRPEPFTDREAYLWSIESAAHKAHRQWFNGSLFEVQRGEFVTSFHAMAAALSWSEKRVRIFIDRMVKAEKWAKRGAYRGAKAPTVLTVLNYELFQETRAAKGEATGEGEGERGAKQGRSKGVEQNEGITKGNEGKRDIAPALPFDDALAIWEQAASHHPAWKPKKPSLDDKRRRGLSTILKEHGIEGWRAGLARAHNSAMLGGPDPPGWFNFSFVTRPDKFNNLLDGNYDEQFDNQQRGGGSNWGAAYSAGSPA